MSPRPAVMPLNPFADDQRWKTAERGSRWLAIGVGVYLLSQIFLIPVAAVGPSWSIWPQLTDFAVGLLAVAAVLTPPGKVLVSRANRDVWRILCWAYAVCVGSFFIVNLAMGSAGRGLAVDEGIYYLYRMTQFMLVYWATMRVAFSPAREKTFAALVAIVFIGTCVACLATFFNVLPGSRITAHLPTGRVAGPWSFFHFDQAQGLGFVGHNHAYVAAQVLLLLALTLNMGKRTRPVFNGAVILLGVITAFASGSRSGLAAALLFAAFMLLRNPVYALGIGLVLGASTLLLPEGFLATE